MKLFVLGVFCSIFWEGWGLLLCQIFVYQQILHMSYFAKDVIIFLLYLLAL